MKDSTSSEAPTPVYYRLQMDILKKIEEGVWKPLQQIPPERKLAELHKLSIGTVKKAILNLVQEGYLFRIQGKGTFVKSTALRSERLRLYRMMKDFSDTKAVLKVKLLSITETEGEEKHREFLNVSREEGFYELRRVFLDEDLPLIYTLSYLPRNMFPNLKAFPGERFEKVTLYEDLEEKYGVTTVSNKELVGAEAAGRETSDILGVEEGTPVLAIDMISYTYKNIPYEYRITYCLADNRKIYMEI